MALCSLVQLPACSSHYALMHFGLETVQDGHLRGSCQEAPAKIQRSKQLAETAASNFSQVVRC